MPVGAHFHAYFCMMFSAPRYTGKEFQDAVSLRRGETAPVETKLEELRQEIMDFRSGQY